MEGHIGCVCAHMQGTPLGTPGNSLGNFEGASSIWVEWVRAQRNVILTHKSNAQAAWPGNVLVCYS